MAILTGSKSIVKRCIRKRFKLNPAVFGLLSVVGDWWQYRFFHFFIFYLTLPICS